MAVNTRAGPDGCREFLTATWPSARCATSTQLPPVGPLRLLFTHRVPISSVAGMPLRTLVILRILQFVDDLVDERRSFLRLVGHDAQPFHGEQIAVHFGLLVEVERTGQVLDVDHVREVTLGEPQDTESGGRRVAANAVRDDLEREVGPRAPFPQVAQLFELDVRASDRAAQGRLVDDDPELELALAEPALALLAQHHMPLGLLDGEVAERDDRGRVLLGLQQARYQLRLVDPDGPRGLLHAYVGLEPLRQDVVVAVPPAG